MDTLEQLVADLQAAGIGVDLVQGFDETGEWRLGVRIKTFGRNLPKNRMVLGTGDTYQEALVQAISKAENGRWENVDYAARPWAVRSGLPGQHRFGL